MSCYVFSDQTTLGNRAGKYGVVMFSVTKQHWDIEQEVWICYVFIDQKLWEIVQEVWNCYICIDQTTLEHNIESMEILFII